MCDHEAVQWPPTTGDAATSTDPTSRRLGWRRSGTVRRARTRCRALRSGLGADRSDLPCVGRSGSTRRALRPGTWRRHRSRLSTRHAAPRRPCPVDLPGCRSAPARRRHAARPQHRDGPGRRLLPGPDGRNRRRPPALAVRERHHALLPLVLAAGSRGGRRRERLRLRRRDVRTRARIPDPNRAGLHRRGGRRREHARGPLDGPTRRRIRLAVRILDRVGPHVDVPLRPLPPSVRLRPVLRRVHPRFVVCSTCHRRSGPERPTAGDADVLDRPGLECESGDRRPDPRYEPAWSTRASSPS